MTIAIEESLRTIEMFWIHLKQLEMYSWWAEW
jgi:hypothetical protein